MFGLAIGSRNGSSSVTDLPSLVNIITMVTKPMKISSRTKKNRFTPEFGSLTGLLELERELVHTTDIQLLK